MNDTEALEPTRDIYEALIRAQQSLRHAELDAVNPHFGSKYASLKSVIDAVKDALNDNGIAFLQSSEPVQGGVQVSTALIHESGERLSGGSVFVPADKTNAHGYGSALTYAKRYSLALTCGISADVDDDANASVHDLVEYNQHVREHWETINVVKDGINEGLRHDPDSQIRHDCWEQACEAWNELTNTQKRSVWLAPTKGGIFTTEERRIIKEELPKFLERGTYESG